MREALGRHVEACFATRFPQEDTGRGAPGAQEFIAKTTQELQDARTMRGDRRPPGATPNPGEDGGLRVCIDIPGLNRAASQKLFWPSRVGRCKGPPHSYVRMPFSLLSMAAAFQRNLQSVLVAQEARHHPVLEEMETVLKEPPGPPDPPEAVPKKKKQLLRTGPQGSGISGGATSGSAPALGAPPSLA